MDEKEQNEEQATETDQPTERAPRARNRTVMLTPEITGRVREQLARELDPGVRPAAPAAPGYQPAPPAAGTQPGFHVPPSRQRQIGADPAYGGDLNAALSGTAPRAPQPPAVDPHSASGAVYAKLTPVVGFLVSFDSNPNGDVYELRSGRLIVTSEGASQGNYLIVRDESVSPMHAILRITQSSEIQVLDQLSEFGTKIKRFGSEQEIELSGDKGTIEHGDKIYFGKRMFHVCLLAGAAAA